jgi:hypothetical protein
LALGNTLLPTQLGNAVLAAKAPQHDTYLLFCRKPTLGLALDILHDSI